MTDKPEAGTIRDEKKLREGAPARSGEGSASGAGDKVVTLHPEFGAGEYVVRGDDGARARIHAGKNTPVDSDVYGDLPRGDDGKLKYPLVEVNEGEGN